MRYHFDEFELCAETLELRNSAGLVAIEPQVFSLLVHLVEHRDRVISKNELIEAIWDGRFVSDSAVTSRIKSARKALGDDGQTQKYIKTLHGRGVRFVAEVTVAATLEGASAQATGDAPADDFVFQDIRFCHSRDGTKVAYARSGEGPPLIKTANWLNHLEYDWQSPVWNHVFTDMMNGRTLLRYDARGNGLSDWEVSDFSFERQVEDLEAVVEASGLDRFPLFGISQGCAVSVAYAVRHPEKVTKLVLLGGYARGWRLAESEKMREETEAMGTLIRSGWGRNNPAFRQMFTTLFMPDAPPQNQDWFNELQRMTTSPENAANLLDALGNVDVRPLLAKVQTSTLVVHCRGDMRVPLASGQELAAGIPGARFMTLESNNHVIPNSDPAWAKFSSAMNAFLSE
jgi:DNA-binding winged helix-turn-helix (wHTH) protein/pimeloyl-ACP methyl ester carboxylesterase